MAHDTTPGRSSGDNPSTEVHAIERFAALVPPALHDASGRVFYSGAAAFERPCPLYLLGLNPGTGGKALEDAIDTHIIGQDLAEARRRPDAWSAYVDDSWSGRAPGSKPIQRRATHLLRSLGLDPRAIPASNAVFLRSRVAADLGWEKADLLAACWPFHAAVIRALGVRAIVCMGSDAGDWVRERIGANVLRGDFIERNERRWRSTWHRNAEELSVLTLSHPARADWTAPASDPSELVRAALESGG
jgi:hypothetical protein